MMEVYKAINAVQAKLAREGIGKFRRNQQQGYNFRGIDDCFNVVAPMLADAGLVILPRVLSRQCAERVNAKGTVLFYVTVEAEFDFVSSADGSKHVVKTFGEAMDSGDKATNKAMSAAMKYALLQTFTIPTEGDNDADATTHEVGQQRADPLETDAARQMIQALRDAAMEGEDALSKAFADMPKSPVKAAVWKAHGAALKEAAAQVAA